jgi:hypothetical protein
MSEDSKILLECDMCSDKYNIHLSDLGINIEDNLCNKCFEKTLIVTNCRENLRVKFCNNILCKVCYYKSLASHVKSQFIDVTLVEEKKLKYARFIKKGTHDKYPWMCEEGHRWFSSIKCIVSGHWCPDRLCQNKKIKVTCREKYGVDYPLQSQEIKDKIKVTCQEKYGVDNPFQSQEFKNKIKVTCREKYGVDNPSQSQEIKDKKIQTCQKNYGVDYSMQSQEIRDKSKATYQEKYGVDNPSQSQEIKDKKIQTCQKNYGVDYSMQSQEIRDKSKATYQEKYGVDYPMQVHEIFQKAQNSLYKYKEYIFPSGRKTQVQGYEPIAIDMLLEIYNENDIQTCNEHKLKIKYTMDNSNHFYYPDLFIISENLIIEVKSDYTYLADEDKNLIKANTCLKYGYKFKFIILDKNKNLVDHHLSF